MLVIMFLALAVLQRVAACPPPFNDPRFIANSTHTTSKLIHAQIPAIPDGEGWTEAVSQVRRCTLQSDDSSDHSPQQSIKYAPLRTHLIDCCGLCL